jgi:Kef-type K+ transport system membrane component KefB
MPESIQFQMTILLAVSLSGRLLSSLVRLPAVVGQIIAALIIGLCLFCIITYGEFVANIAIGVAIILMSLLTTLIVPFVFRTMTYKH